MGTSKGYQAPRGGDWTDLKREATQFAKPGSRQSASDVSGLLGSFIRAHGGAKGWASGGGSGGTGGTGGNAAIGHAARTTGRRLGGFLTGVGAGGLGQALEDMGLADLAGLSASDISGALLDKLAGPASTLDGAAVRAALAALLLELFGAATTIEAMEQLLTTVLNAQGVVKVVTRFFALYLYEYFCRFFYEAWSKKVGEAQANRSLRSVKDVIDSGLRAKLATRDVRRFNWDGPEGQQLAQAVLQDTLDIFGGST